MTPEEWFGYIYGTTETGWLTIFAVDRSSGAKHTEWAPVTDLAAAARHVEKLAPTCCVWHGVATRTEQLGGGQRGSVEHCDLIPGLWLDVDIAGPGHASGVRYPPDEAAARDLVATFPLPPTVIVQTGGGLQPWWLFDEPLAAADAPPLLARWAATWQAAAERLGYAIDSVWDVPRVLRVPGTMNRKTDTPRPVTVTDEAWHNRYGTDDLDFYLIDPPAPPAPSRVPYAGEERPGDAFNARHDGGEILERLGFHTPHRKRNGETDYVRQGKTPREGYSATVYPDGHVSVWSSTCQHQWPDLKIGHGYDPFGLLVATTYRGDFAEAGRDLREQGYGEDGTTTIADPNWLDRVMVAVAPPQHLVDEGPLPAPQPLPGLTGTTPTFPLHVLPDWISEPCASIAEGLQVPVDLPASIALGCLATLTHGKVKVTVPGSPWSEWTNLFLAVALPSGTGKSPAFKMLAGVIYDLEREGRGDAKQALLDAESKVRLLTAKLKAAENKVVMGNDPGAEAERLRCVADLAAAEQPVGGQQIADDATPESLVDLMGANGGRLAVLSSEGIVFDSMAGQYVDRGTSANVDVYLKGFSGDTLRQNRVKRGAVEIERAILTIAVCTQPLVLEKLARSPELVARGATARFMYAVPTVPIGDRDRSAIYTEVEVAGWEAGARHIGERFARVEHPLTVPLTSEAAKVFTAWDQATERRCKAGADLALLAEWVQKLRSCVLRVAGLLAVADDAREVDLATLERALQIAGYWLAHAKTVHAMWGVEDADLTIAKRVAEWLLARRPEVVTARELHRAVYHFGPVVKGGGVEAMPGAVAVLVDHGWLVPDDSLWITHLGRGKPSPMFRVPALDGVASDVLGEPNGVDRPNHLKGAEIPHSVAHVAHSLNRGIDPHLSLYDSSPPHPPTPRLRDLRDTSPEDHLGTDDGGQPATPSPPAPVLDASGLFGGPCDDDDDELEEGTP